MTKNHPQRDQHAPLWLLLTLIIVSICALVAPLYATAAITQELKDTVTTDAPKSSGGWTQQLGTGLSGTPGKVSLPVIVTGGPPFSFSPNPFLEFHECDDATYTQCRWFSGSGPVPSPFTPQHLNEIPVDSVFSVDMSAMNALNPSKYYVMSFGLIIVRGAGSIQVRGSATDTFTHGATDAGALADLAFSIEGIIRTSATTSTTTLATSTNATTTPSVPEEPTPSPTPELFVSSVLFLPGFKGSELFRTNTACPLLGVASTAQSAAGCDWKLWLPAADSEVSKLFLTPQGDSRDPNIYTRPNSVLSSAFGKKFYASFIETMERAEMNVSFGTGWQFEPAAYDWRLASAAIAEQGVMDVSGRLRYSEHSSLPYLQSRIRALASTSPTGKVTIVGHSYGGIVARALTQALGEDAPKIIDSLLLVGAPEHGAPRALGALLFGDREAIPGVSFLPNFILTNATARTMGLSSAAAYELLPDGSYFERAPESDRHILRFANERSYTLERQAYGEGIDSRPELLAYATAATIPRPQPSDRDVTRPAVLSSYLIANAENADYARDRALPSSISVHRIAGWGESTLSGFEYRERQRFVLGTPIGSTTVYIPTFTQSGDGVVPYWSAAGVPSENTHDHRLDLTTVNRGAGRISHANLLEAPQTQSIIASILRGSNSTSMSMRRAAMETESTIRLRIMVLGTTALSIRDSQGNKTGVMPDGSLREEIPSASYGEIGAYSYVELAYGEEYEVRIHGLEDGVFTVSVMEDDGSGSPVITSIVDVPSTTKTNATMHITSGGSLSALEVDVDGDETLEGSIEASRGNEVPYRPTAKNATESKTASVAVKSVEKKPADEALSPPPPPVLKSVATSVVSVNSPKETSTTSANQESPTFVTAPDIETGEVSVARPYECTPWWLRFWQWIVALVVGVVPSQ